MTFLSKRVNVKAILADADLRRKLMVSTIQATQAREGIETSPAQADRAYLRARVAELEAERAPKPRDESVPPTSDGPAMQRLLDVRCHLRYIANDLHTSDRTAMHMQEVARECLGKTHSMRVLEREHEARVRADERARIAKELHRMAVAETESDQRSAGLHEAAMFVERGAK